LEVKEKKAKFNFDLMSQNSVKVSFENTQRTKRIIRHAFLYINMQPGLHAQKQVAF